MRLLDLGCGSGKHLVGLPYEVHGLDPDSSAIAQAQCTVDGVFVVGRAEAIPFPAEYFDRITAGVSIPYMNMPVAFAEIARTLKCGGLLEFSYHPFRQVWGYFLRALTGGHPKAAMFYAYALTNGVYFHFSGRVFAFFYNGKYESFQTVRGMALALSQAGLKMTDYTTDMRNGLAPRVWATKP